MARGKARRQSAHHGILVVDKPEGFTSQDAVNIVRKAAQTRRVGHTGTLDPMATGVLVMVVGEASKLSEYLTGFDKAYEGELRLGAHSDTYDATGRVVVVPDAAIPSGDELRALAARWTGDIQQVPPPYSAVKVAGRKLYEYAREGEQVEARPRPVRVDEYAIDDPADGVARFRIRCSSGGYVRSLVHEVGQAAGCGALVQSLRRTAVGDIDISEAVRLDALREGGHDAFLEHLLPMVDACTHWPVYYVRPNEAGWLRRGQAIPASLAAIDSESAPVSLGGLCFLCPHGGDAMAVGKLVAAPPGKPPADLARHSGFWFQPVKLLCPDPSG